MTNTRRRLLAALSMVLAAWLALVPAGIASASSYPPDEPTTVTVTNPQGPPGYPVRVVVDGCIPGERVVITLGDRTVEVVCDDETIQVVVEIPAPTVPGDYDVVVTFPDREDGPVLTASIEVVEPGSSTVAPAAPGALPRAGSDSTFGTAWLAAGLLVVGLGMVIVARMRRSGDAAS